MTRVKCTESQCFHNQDGLCQLEEVELDNTNDVFECLRMEAPRDLEIRDNLLKVFSVNS